MHANPEHPNDIEPAATGDSPRLADGRGGRRRWGRWGLVGIGIAAAALGSACTANVDEDVLTVTGLNGPEVIALRLQPGDANTLVVDWNADGTAEFTFARDTFSRIEVDGAGGDDRIVIDQSAGGFTDTEITTIRGGEGNDTLVGGFGTEQLDGGAGDDVLDGNLGADVLIGGAGADVIQWDPGDSNDTVDGGADADRLVFNGSNIGEILGVSPVGDHVRLTRDVANIVMDLDGVEAIDLNTVGGADQVKVDPIAGTDLTTVTANFAAAAGGGDDAQIDEVIVPPGLAIGQDRAAATVDGLGAQVRVVGGANTDRISVLGTAGPDVQPVKGTPSADAVNVTANGTSVAIFGATAGVYVNTTGVEVIDADLGGGNDSFSAVGNLAALVALDVDGGAGADTILGSNGADVLDGGDDADVVDGNQGVDSVRGGAGADVFQWDPGDGNDVFDGGPNLDRMVFNGSAANEIFGFNAIGDHVQFTRNIASILLDLDNVETFDLNALAGIDQVLPGSLAGTDLATFNVNLAGFGGVDDAQIDEVVVPVGTAISSDGTAATVGGFGANLRVAGGAGSDRVHVMGTVGPDVQPLLGTGAADEISAIANGTDVSVFGATPGVGVLLTAVERLDVDLLGGNDSFSATGNLAALIALDVDGGAGEDTIRGGNGADVLVGGDDADFLDGNQGIDQVSGGAGADAFQWDPGDGNDTIDGGSGADRMTFFGSATNELFGFAAVGDHVRFTRNVASIVLDLDGVETFELNALAGTDVVQVDSVAGTDLTTITTNLAAFGVTDGAADQVIVNGTAGDDALTVTASGSTVQVGGLAALVQVTGADPTLDRLTVNGLAGADSITASGDVGTLILLDLLP